MPCKRGTLHITLLAALLTGSAAASAHVVLAETQAKAGSYHAAFLRVGHGCAGSPTLSIRVEIPADVRSAHPQPKPGWTLSVEKAGERVTAIRWTGRLEADQFDQFGMMLKLPETPGKLYFPTVQRCETGENDWTMIPASGQSPHDLKSPAPVLDLTTGDAIPMDHMHM